MEEYQRYTGPQIFYKAMHTLEGILKGIAVDEKLNTEELLFVEKWLQEHIELVTKYPFKELAETLREGLADGQLDAEEKADMLWQIKQLTSENGYFDASTSDLHRLQGMMAGIAADNIIEPEELNGLADWLREHQELQTHWPYDEVYSLVLDALSQRQLSKDKHQALLAYFNGFGEAFGKANIVSNKNQALGGVCAVAPEIEFEDRLFCLTGESQRLKRKEISNLIESQGGIFKRGLTVKTNYLITCTKGNQAWAYSAYGRKVEEAMMLRQKGNPILIIHESDFWDALADYGVEIS